MSATKTILYEAYFDLWGFKSEDIHTIQEAIMDFAVVDEECESTACPANMSTIFRSSDEKRVDDAIKLYEKLTKRKKKNPEIIGYGHY